jgi:hypothetical protein
MELNQKTIDSSYKLMEMITKGCNWYHDTSEQPFEYSPGSIWLINPETKQWMLDLKKSGNLFYYHKIFDTFSKYLSMEESDFESFIKLWVEDALKRGVRLKPATSLRSSCQVEDALKRGMILTEPAEGVPDFEVEDALKRGVILTLAYATVEFKEVEEVLKNGKQWN